MGSEFKKKKKNLLAAAASSPLLRTAAIFLMRQFTDAHKSRLTPHKGGVHTPSGSHGHRSSGTFRSFCSHLFRSLTMASAHQVPPQGRKEGGGSWRSQQKHFPRA